MIRFDYRPEPDRLFVGRERELRWIADQMLFRRGSFHPPLITGPAGVGKSALVRQFFSTHRFTQSPIWIDMEPEVAKFEDLLRCVDIIQAEIREKKIYERTGREGGLLICIDGIERFTELEVDRAVSMLYNFKAVRAVVMTSRRHINIKRGETWELSGLEGTEARDLLNSMIDFVLPEEVLARAEKITGDIPLAVRLLGSALRDVGLEGVNEVLQGKIYDAAQSLIAPDGEFSTIVKPVIISASTLLAEKLKAQPHSVVGLSPRQFEELLAELLNDMGYEVQLTKATRDGGKDILAFMNTPLGKTLCLVEAKKYRQDRTIGVELVRTLYGTLCDYQANSAMLVTTSTFSKDAKEFQSRHEYQLSLRDYGHLVDWIKGYKQGSKASGMIGAPGGSKFGPVY